MRTTTPLLLLAILAGACSNQPQTSDSTGSAAMAAETPAVPETPAAVDVPDPDSASPEELVAAMRSDVSVLMAKPEHTADEVEVQHILIAFAGAGVPGVGRSRDEAEALAAKIWAQARSGADFLELVDVWSDDKGASYRMSLAGPARPPTVYARRGMVAAFGDVGWRLAVGEIGVAAHAPRVSPYGWHVIKRVE